MARVFVGSAVKALQHRDLEAVFGSLLELDEEFALRDPAEELRRVTHVVGYLLLVDLEPALDVVCVVN